MTGSQHALQKKEMGNALFKQKNYDAAIRHFSEAIALDSRDPTFYSNRAASFYFIGRYQEAITDCQIALQLDPRYAKAWLRKGDAHDALKQYAESIESYQRALPLSASQDYPEIQQRILAVTSKIMHPATMNLVTLLTIARAHSIPIPRHDQIHTPSQTETLRKALLRHPKWGSSPKVRYLLVPEDESLPIRNIELEMSTFGKLDGDVRRALGTGCRGYTEELLWSDDLAECAKGRPNGVGIGRSYATYECVFDPTASRHGRALNKRACHLVGRGDIYGPVLFKKTNRIRIHQNAANGGDELGWETLTPEELRSDEFRLKRREWGMVRIR